MNADDRERLRLEKLEALKRENGVSVESAQREARTGPAAANHEELARGPEWRVTRTWPAGGGESC